MSKDFYEGNEGTIAAVKALDMTDFLAGLGLHPEKIKGDDYWYLSPFRNERTASFKINRRLNKWYDHGMGKGGSIIDFGIYYFNCTLSEFLDRMHKHSPIQTLLSQPPTTRQKDSKIEIISVAPLTSFKLVRYLVKRKIPLDIMQQYCCQVTYKVKGISYDAIGFKNDSGGYELRTAFFKGSTSPKDITTISNRNDQVAVFEGFTDFLSFIATQQKPILQTDFLILNSLSFFERARPFLERHDQIHLYLDRDAAGQNCTSYALSVNSNYEDKSSLYEGVKDLNEWLTQSTRTKKQGKAPRLR